MVAGQPWSPAEMAQVAAQYDFEPVPAERSGPASSSGGD